MKALLALAPLALAACTPTPAPAPVYRAALTAEGTPVSLRQPVEAAGAVLTAIAVSEDSRCPINARCIWAGRIIVTTLIAGPGWTETVNLELGKPQAVRDYRFGLVSAEPGKLAGRQTQAIDYRFVFEGSRTSS